MTIQPVEHLSRAPIIEALLDLRATLPDGFNADAFRSAHAAIGAAYPTAEKQRRVAVQAQIKTAGKHAVSSTDVPWAYIFKSADGLTIAQFRVNGFTLNRLAPYRAWSELLPEALRLWSLYAEIAQPLAVPRIAVRYINRLAVGTDERRREWMTWGPVVPEGLPGQLSQYTIRLETVMPATGTTIVTAQALERGLEPESLSVILDIDAFRVADHPPDPAALGAALEDLRVLKNAVFFGSLTAAGVAVHR